MKMPERTLFGRADGVDRAVNVIRSSAYTSAIAV